MDFLARIDFEVRLQFLESLDDFLRRPVAMVVRQREEVEAVAAVVGRHIDGAFTAVRTAGMDMEVAFPRTIGEQIRLDGVQAEFRFDGAAAFDGIRQDERVFLLHRRRERHLDGAVVNRHFDVAFHIGIAL